ncbi:MAG: hypothetical protein KDK08_10340, partial [Rhizobiaceae bacterium]|nr:hypothetical protein [Rhizobiaceae bacterium]
ELHVELVVFDDHHLFWHNNPALLPFGTESCSIAGFIKGATPARIDSARTLTKRKLPLGACR